MPVSSPVRTYPLLRPLVAGVLYCTATGMNSWGMTLQTPMKKDVAHRGVILVAEAIRTLITNTIIINKATKNRRETLSYKGITKTRQGRTHRGYHRNKVGCHLSSAHLLPDDIEKRPVIINFGGHIYTATTERTITSVKGIPPSGANERWG